MRKTAKKTFTMIEILLALGVTAIGICSIMVLFPIGATANHDAAMESYGSNAADQVLRELKRVAVADWGYLASIKEKSEAPSQSDDSGMKFSFDPMAASPKENWATTPFGSSNIIPSTTYPGAFLVISHRYGEGGERKWHKESSSDVELLPEDIDAAAILYLTKSQIELNGHKVNYNFGMTLQAEVSWPASMPYAARKKAHYVIDIFKY